MGRKKRPVDGVVRDQRTGIVLARQDRHPGADLFRDAPMGEGLPGMHMPGEAEHILAIHFFDNLGYPVTPPNPLYRAVADPERPASAGQEGVLWVPVGDVKAKAVPEDAPPVVVADISGYDDDQITALKAQIRQREIAKKLLEQADPHVREERGDDVT